jgi:hypothetical protein
VGERHGQTPESAERLADDAEAVQTQGVGAREQAFGQRLAIVAALAAV